MMTYFCMIQILILLHFLIDDMSFNTIGINNINLDDDHNFDEEDPETIVHVKLMAQSNDFNNGKNVKNK